MWIVVINNIKYGYDSYKNACQNINGYNIKFDGLFFIKDN